jgi:uncharacterized alpha-E superfamily protein
MERADMTTRIIDARTANLLPAQATELRPFESLQWMSVLNSLDAYYMYRKRQQTQVSRRQVLRFLIQDPRFPRSTLYSLRALRESFHQLPNSQRSLELLKGMEQSVRHPQVLELRQGTLHVFLDELQYELIALHNNVNETYFIKRQPCADTRP